MNTVVYYIGGPYDTHKAPLEDRYRSGDMIRVAIQPSMNAYNPGSNWTDRDEMRIRVHNYRLLQVSNFIFVGLSEDLR